MISWLVIKNKANQSSGSRLSKCLVCNSDLLLLFCFIDDVTLQVQFICTRKNVVCAIRTEIMWNKFDNQQVVILLLAGFVLGHDFCSCWGFSYLCQHPRIADMPFKGSKLHLRGDISVWHAVHWMERPFVPWDPYSTTSYQRDLLPIWNSCASLWEAMLLSTNTLCVTWYKEWHICPILRGGINKWWPGAWNYQCVSFCLICVASHFWMSPMFASPTAHEQCLVNVVWRSEVFGSPEAQFSTEAPFIVGKGLIEFGCCLLSIVTFYTKPL